MLRRQKSAPTPLGAWILCPERESMSMFISFTSISTLPIACTASVWKMTPKNLIDGGGQEGAHRAGTENVAGIVALGRAIELATADIPKKVARVSKLRDKLIGNILKIEHTRLNGDPVQRLCGNVNISFEGVEGESLLLSLDNEGICASSGSACTSGSLDPSHVLLSIGLTHEVAHGSLRLSISEDTSGEDIDYILEKIPPVISRLRAMSPLWERIKAAEK